jgi:hypothetical protein
VEHHLDKYLKQKFFLHWFRNDSHCSMQLERLDELLTIAENMCRWAMVCNAVMLICEVGIITATFIFLRNELAWKKLLEASGRPVSVKVDRMMLIVSMVTTASVICLAILGSGNITSGLKNVWRGVRKVCKIAPSVLPSSMLKGRTFLTGQDLGETQLVAAEECWSRNT